jgi:hypothetical protein
MKKESALCLSVLLIALLSFSCSSRAVLVMEGGSPELKGAVTRLAAEYSKKGGLSISALDAKASAQGALIAIGWEFPGQGVVARQVRIPASSLREAGFATAQSFIEGEDALSRVPLLWDAWGLGGSASRLASLNGDKAFSWKDRADIAAARLSILAPGGEAGTRQALFWLSDVALPGKSVISDLMTGRAFAAGAPNKAFFESYAVLERDKALFPGTLHYRTADVSDGASRSANVLVMGSYSWQRTLPSEEARGFKPLVYTQEGGYAMPVALLAGRVEGKGRAAKRAADFLLWLCQPEQQRALSEASGLMACNFNAPNLDVQAASCREVATGASAIVLIDPEPSGPLDERWDSLLGAVLSRSSEWERVLSEFGAPGK